MNDGAHVQLATIRELAAAGSVRETILVGQVGGYSVRFKIGMGERILATRRGEPRLFGGVDVAARVLRGIGIARFEVDASNVAEDDLLTRRRTRPDRREALLKAHRDAAYLEELQERAEIGRKDPVRRSHDQVNEAMQELRRRTG